MSIVSIQCFKFIKNYWVSFIFNNIFIIILITLNALTIIFFWKKKITMIHITSELCYLECINSKKRIIENWLQQAFFFLAVYSKILAYRTDISFLYTTIAVSLVNIQLKISWLGKQKQIILGWEVSVLP